MQNRNVHEALELVQSLRGQLLARQWATRGFAGPTRILSGCLALLMAATMASPWFPQTVSAHFTGWTFLLIAALAMNVFSLAYFFLHEPAVGRDWHRLRPILDVAPPLLVGAGLTLAFWLRQETTPLFGLWMCMVGLGNFAVRQTLPSALSLVGLFYIVAGLLCLALPSVQFTNPWPMAIVFFAGEVAGGSILIRDRRRFLALPTENNQKESPHA